MSISHLSNWGIIHESTWVFQRLISHWTDAWSSLSAAGKARTALSLVRRKGLVLLSHFIWRKWEWHVMKRHVLGLRWVTGTWQFRPVVDQHLSFQLANLWVYSTPFAIWASGECLRFQEEALLHMFLRSRWTSTVGPLPALSRGKMGTLNSLFYFAEFVCVCFIALVCRCIGRHCLWFPLTFNVLELNSC